MEQLLKNAIEFFESGNDNLAKNRFNVSVSDFFKSIVIFCDYLIYEKIRIIPKNHNHRFNLLETYFEEIHQGVSKLFKTYIQSYNLNMGKSEAQKLKEYANELKNTCLNKK
ncbi:hypothetical protein KAI32_00575 [Candidatus Pacearchaeota archaeon]|nr:hypothetical protein [Candidatus Pacearchaeota archaeon]